MIDNVFSLLSKVEKDLTYKKATRDVLIKELQDTQNKITEYSKTLEDNNLILVLYRTASEQAKNMVKSGIEEIVSNCLNVIYGGNHRFIIRVEERRNQHELDYFIHDGYIEKQLKRPFIGNSGAKVSTVGFALQLALLVRTNASGVCCLDEITKMMDGTVIGNVAYFLKEFASFFKKQLILVTHHSEVADVADKVYFVNKPGDTSIVVEQNNE